MLNELCRELRNYFVLNPKENIINDEYKIVDGRLLSVDFIKNGQYFYIAGSTFNDGIHKYPCDDLTDETFKGQIWLMSVPYEFIKLSQEIKSYVDKYEEMTPYTSESFGGYSYSKNGAGDWKTVFANKLNRWRKI